MTTMELPFRDLDPPPLLPEGMIHRAGILDSPRQRRLYAALEGVLAVTPPTRIRTRGGGSTSAAMTNCGAVGWWSDSKGYRYVSTCPGTGLPWPAISLEFSELIQMVAAESR